MDIRAARAAIEAILAAIPDEELPEFERVEIHEGRTTVWWGGKGRTLGSARTGNNREPLGYRRSASWEAIEGEMAYRADKRYLENGDKPDGLRLAKRMAV